MTTAQRHSFDRNMLPCLGVTWHRFANRNTAAAFARWAERETRNDQYPCEAFVTSDDRNPADERWEVKVRNW